MKKDLDCLIVEDDPFSCLVLEQLILTRTDLKLKGVFNDAELAYEYLSADFFTGLLFLDIELKNGSGIEMAKKLSPVPDIIFTTTHEKFAINAYEVGALDYLRKPIDPKRFDLAIERYLLNKSLKNQVKKGNDRPEDYQFFKTGKELIKLKTNDILFFEAAKDYVKIHTGSGVYLILSTMKELEAKLDVNTFLRISKSFIVNLTLIDRITGNMLAIQKKNLKISRSYLFQVKKRIEIFQKKA